MLLELLKNKTCWCGLIGSNVLAFQLLPSDPVLQLHHQIPKNKIIKISVHTYIGSNNLQVIQELHGGQGHRQVQGYPKEAEMH